MKTCCAHSKSCLNDSTAHGLPHLVKPGRSIVSKIFWVLCFLLAASLFLMHSFTLLMQYLKVPTRMTLSTDSNFIPPDVYICNRMPFSMGKVENPENHNNSEFRRLQTIINSNVYMYSEELFQNFSLNSLYHAFGGRNFTEFYRKLQILFNGRDFETPGSFVLEIVPNNRHLSCYRLKTLYRDHIFNGVNNLLDIFLYSDSVAFLKPKVMINTQIRFEKRHRPLASLKATSLDNPSTVGFVVYIVAPGYYPHPDSLSIEATAGFHTHIKLKMSTFNLLNKPETPCTKHNKSVKYYNFIDPSRPVELKAGQWDCVYKKYHELALSECNCTSHIYPVTDELWRTGRVVYCQHHLKSQRKHCLDNKGVNNKLEMLYSQCFVDSPCQRLKYQSYVEESLINIEELTQFGLHFDGQQHKYSYKDIYDRLLNIRNESALNVLKIKESFHKIRIQRGEILSNHWQQNYTYLLPNFLSDIGGIMGFYMGVGVLTFCELIGLCIACMSEEKRNNAGSNVNLEMMTNK